MLTCEKVAVRRGDFTLKADLVLPTGGVKAVMGPSGGGKSTFLSLIAGFVEPDAGRILWNESPLNGLAPGKRPVAMLFQDNNLFPHLDVMTNVCLGADPSGRPDAALRARAEEALTRVGLAGFGARKPAALSGGQQSRAALARVLLTDKPLVLMDEPFSALGPALKDEMLDLVAELLSGATILMVTHDPEDARRIAPETVVVANGQVSPAQPTSALLENPPPALAAYLSAKPH